jgi:uncharacterized protein YecE (DUF72 family)
VPELRIGCSGWAYAHWAGAFYPPGLRAKDRLAFYAERFDTCEINASFYRLPRESAVAAWRDGVPADFRFAWKVSRFISHNKKLLDCEDSVELVFGRMRPLAGKQGPALIQLPPMLKANPERLAAFAAWLPKDVRCAFEFRHPSWYEPPVLDVLRDHNLALVISDHHHAPAPWLVTADFVYVRGHGPGGRYQGRYPATELAEWAGRIANWQAEGREVWVYFDNDVKSAAPADAAALKVLCRDMAAPG